MRLFVAVDLSDDAREAIAAEQKRIAAALGCSKSSLKWVKPEQVHLTLVFLGSVDDRACRGCRRRRSARDVDLAPFDMVLDGVGVFPPRGAPRVLWIGRRAAARTS